MAISPSAFLATFIFLSFTLCLLLLCNKFRGQRRRGESRVRCVSQCRIEKLGALEPTRRVLSEKMATRSTLIRSTSSSSVPMCFYRDGKVRESTNVMEAYRTMKIRQNNVGDPMRVDCFSPHAGRITTLDSRKLRTPRFVQTSAVRGLLHPNATVSPQRNANAHSIMYVLGGCCTHHRGLTVFDGELPQGQLLFVPQSSAVTIQAQHESFEWVSIKTNDNAIVNHCDVPVEVPKLNRGKELTLFTPKYKRASRVM